jgi:hypothetical protein
MEPAAPHAGLLGHSMQGNKPSMLMGGHVTAGLLIQSVWDCNCAKLWLCDCRGLREAGRAAAAAVLGSDWLGGFPGVR